MPQVIPQELPNGAVNDAPNGVSQEVPERALERAPDGAPRASVNIAAVERDTGLTKDTLRVWERRYGFPAPLRDVFGERLYPPDQVEKLRIIRRLMDQGLRPGKIVAAPIETLMAQLSQLETESTKTTSLNTAAQDVLHSYLGLIKSHQVEALRSQLSESALRLGLARFVYDVVAPLTQQVGLCWINGELQIFEEHLYTESVQMVLRQAINTIPGALHNGVAKQDDPQTYRPRVLLTTFPQESHGLGLLMAESIFALEGCRCLSLGVQTPIPDILLAAQVQQADIVALSFSACMNANQVVQGLEELRTKLSNQVEIWVGGSCSVLYRKSIVGVLALRELAAIPQELLAWQQRQQGQRRSLRD